MVGALEPNGQLGRTTRELLARSVKVYDLSLGIEHKNGFCRAIQNGLDAKPDSTERSH